MNYRKLLWAIGVAVCIMPATARQPESELTKAMFRAYNQTLEEDPNDYLTLYRRALEYFRIGSVDNAMIDLDNAMTLTPAKDTDLLSHEYSLKADLLAKKGDFKGALTAINEALTLYPESYSDTYKKGNIQLELKDSEGALRTFQSMLRMKSRSQEAFYGMARAYAQKGDDQQALQMIEEMQNLDSASALTFSRIGDIYQDMGQNDKSVVNYLTAVSMGQDLARPIAALEQIAAKDYAGFCRGFDFAQSQNATSKSISYIRGSIAANTDHNTDAYEILSGYMNGSTDQSASALVRMAKVCLALGKMQEARQYADAALVSDPGYSDAYLVKSAVELAAGNSANALLFANKAYSPADPDEASLVAIAKAAIARADVAKAMEALNEAALIDAESPAVLLLRAYVHEYLMGDKKSALSDYERAANVEARYFPEVAYKAMAQTLSGRLLDGEATIEKALVRDASPQAMVYSAIYYVQTGAQDKADALLDKARDMGYDNIYLMEKDTTPLLSTSKKK